MIVCPRCGKDNQTHYKFCLGCGAELGNVQTVAAAQQARAIASGAALAMTEAPDSAALAETEPPSAEEVYEVAPGTDAGVGGIRARASASLAQAMPAVAPAVATAQTCTACGTESPNDFVFCGNCGMRLKQAPAAPLFRSHVGPGVAESAAAPRAVPAVPPAFARLALIRPDGSEGGSFVLRATEVAIGRSVGDLFTSDAFLSPQHARIYRDDEQIWLEDSGSLNGTFVRITEQEPLEDGDIFRIGQELLCFEFIREPRPAEDGTEIMGSPNPGYWGRLSLIVGQGAIGCAFPLMGVEMVLGRERGDILFSDDGYVSGIHAKVMCGEDGLIYLVDLGSSNGTFTRLRASRPITFGTFILMGQQLFRLEQVAD